MVKVKQSDIARELGISQVAVSKALRGAPDISGEIRDKILSTASRMGYRKNMIASSLAEGKTKIIGYLMPSSAGEFFINLLTSIQSTLQKHDYQVLIKTFSQGTDVDDQDIELFLNYNVDGIITFPKTVVPWDKSIYKRVLEQKVPIIFINQSVPLDGAISVYSDDVEGSFKAVSHLIQNGHRNIGLIQPDHPNDTAAHRRYKGYCKALKQHGLAINNDYIIRFSDLCERKNKIKEMLTSQNKLTAICCYNDHEAIEVYEAAEELKLRIPDDISVIGYGNDIKYNRLLKTPLTTVSQCGAVFGGKAAELLLNVIDEKSVESQHIIPTNLIMGRSVKHIGDD